MGNTLGGCWKEMGVSQDSRRNNQVLLDCGTGEGRESLGAKRAIWR